MIDRIASYNMNMIIATPALDDYASQIRVQERLSYIESNLSTQYKVYAMAAKGIEAIYTPIGLEKDQTGEELLDEIYASPVWAREEIQDIKVIRPEDFAYTPDNYYSESNLKNMQRLSDIQGAEDYSELIAEFTVDGMIGYQCFTLGKYEGRWYVRDINTNISSMMGANVNLAGLLIPDILEDLEH